MDRSLCTLIPQKEFSSLSVLKFVQRYCFATSHMYHITIVELNSLHSTKLWIHAHGSPLENRTSPSLDLMDDSYPLALFLHHDTYLCFVLWRSFLLSTSVNSSSIVSFIIRYHNFQDFQLLEKTDLMFQVHKHFLKGSDDMFSMGCHLSQATLHQL